MYPCPTLQSIGILYILLADFENIIIEISKCMYVFKNFHYVINKRINKEEEET